jgi:hypothetical protein
MDQVVLDAAEIAVDPRGDMCSELKVGIIGHGRFSGSSTGLGALEFMVAGLFRPLFADALRVSLNPLVPVAAVFFLPLPSLGAVLFSEGFDLAVCRFQVGLIPLPQFSPSIRKAVYDFHAQIRSLRRGGFISVSSILENRGTRLGRTLRDPPWELLTDQPLALWASPKSGFGRMLVNFRRFEGPAAAISVGEGFAAFGVLLGLIVTFQVLDGAYASSFGVSIEGNNDETAHLVTSLMIRDLITSLDFRHPWQFAQDYYYHYPRVAIGHWPPALYGTIGIWFLAFGASHATSMIFIAIVAATTATVIYFTGKRLIGRWAGVLSAVLFLASPLVQESSARLMPEHLVTLAMLVL